MNSKEHITSIILDYENGKETIEETLKKVNELATTLVDEDGLNNYYKSQSLDEFIAQITIDPIANWQTITDNQALQLIKEIKSNVTKDSIVNRNSAALEKRYQKSTGFISDLIFHNDLSVEAILKELKKETVICL